MRNRIVLLGVVIGLLVGAAAVGLIVVKDDNQATRVSTLRKLPVPGGWAAYETADAGGPVAWQVRGELPKLPDHATAYRTRTPATADDVSSSVACSSDGPPCPTPPPTIDITTDPSIKREALGDYPLVSVDKGFERLEDQPVPMIDIYPPPTIRTRTITGAHLGLLAVPAGEWTYLEPAFVFELADGGEVKVVALVDELLAVPRPGGPPPAPGGPPQEVPPAPPNPGGGGSSSESCAGSSSASSGGGGEQNQPLTIEVCASPSSPKVGETVTFRLEARDPDAPEYDTVCPAPPIFGDEQDPPVRCTAVGCAAEDPPSPESRSASRTYTHAYAKPGTYTAVFAADSCGGPKSSRGEVQLQITVTG